MVPPDWVVLIQVENVQVPRALAAPVRSVSMLKLLGMSIYPTPLKLIPWSGWPVVVAIWLGPWATCKLPP